MSIRRVAVLTAFLTSTVMPLAAQAQQVNPYKPMVTSPPGNQNPALINPSDPGIQGNTTGVIAPPAQSMSRMPVIKPTTPSNMPVIVPPPATAAGPAPIAK